MSDSSGSGVSVPSEAVDTSQTPKGSPEGARSEHLMAAGGTVATLAVVVGVWAVLTSGNEPIVAVENLPSIGDTARAFGREYRGTSAFEHASASVGRLAVSLSIGTCLGLLVATLMSLNPVLRGALRPVVHALLWVSPVLLFPFAVLWFGIGGFIVPLTSAAVTSFVAWRTHAALIERADGDRLDLVREVATTIRIAAFLAWSLVFIFELIGAREGLGAVAYSARPFFRSDVMLAYAILAGLVAMAIDGILRLAQHAVSK